MTAKRVLIVHAAHVMRMMIKDMLMESGFEVVGEAVNGLQALENYRRLLPDVVTMDMIMPEMDGMAAVKAIVSEFPQANILICTSMTEETLADVMEAGARGFITKPFERPELFEAIKQVLAKERGADG